MIEPCSLPLSQPHLVQVRIWHIQRHRILPHTIYQQPFLTHISRHGHDLPIRLECIIVNCRLVSEPMLGRRVYDPLVSRPQIIRIVPSTHGQNLQLAAVRLDGTNVEARITDTAGKNDLSRHRATRRAQYRG